MFEKILNDYLGEIDTLDENSIAASEKGETTTEKIDKIDEELKKIDAHLRK